MLLAEKVKRSTVHEYSCHKIKLLQPTSNVYLTQSKCSDETTKSWQNVYFADIFLSLHLSFRENNYYSVLSFDNINMLNQIELELIRNSLTVLICTSMPF